MLNTVYKSLFAFLLVLITGMFSLAYYNSLRPDLAIISVEVYGLKPERACYTAVIKNIGNRPLRLHTSDDPPDSGATLSVQAYFSNDSIHNTEGDKPAGDSQVIIVNQKILAAGDSITFNGNVRINDDLNVWKNLTVKIDHLNTVLEYNEDNNTASTLLQPEHVIRPDPIVGSPRSMPCN